MNYYIVELGRLRVDNRVLVEKTLESLLVANILADRFQVANLSGGTEPFRSVVNFESKFRIQPVDTVTFVAEDSRMRQMLDFQGTSYIKKGNVVAFLVPADVAVKTSDFENYIKINCDIDEVRYHIYIGISAVTLSDIYKPFDIDGITMPTGFIGFVAYDANQFDDAQKCVCPTTGKRQIQLFNG